MLDIKVDSQLQVAAALSLLESSRLVEWRADEMQFSAVERKRFESAWRDEVHPVFGRLICWISFSAGAELLAKGACLANGIEIRRLHTVPVYPQSNFGEWANFFLQEPRCSRTVEVPHFGTLGDLIYDKPDRPAALRQLCHIMEASQKDEQRVPRNVHPFSQKHSQPRCTRLYPKRPRPASILGSSALYRGFQSSCMLVTRRPKDD